MDRLEAALERIILDPKYHDVLTLVKAVRNGVVYGTKVRFPHALVMIFLFRSGTLREKLLLIFKATRTHARNLGLFALIYKTSMLILRHSRSGKEGHYDTFMSGLVGGYYVFGRHRSSVAQQIVIYIFARVCLGLAQLAVQPVGQGEIAAGGGGIGLWQNNPKMRERVREGAWPVFASISWAAVMYMFRWHPEVIQSSLRSSMDYIYVQSDHWDSLRTFAWHNK